MPPVLYFLFDGTPIAPKLMVKVAQGNGFEGDGAEAAAAFMRKRGHTITTVYAQRQR